MYDVIIIGGGPAGLTSALYAQRAGLKTLILEKLVLGGQLGTTYEIENYPGIEDITGPELVAHMESHAKKFGAEIKYEEAIELLTDEKEKTIITNDNQYTSRAVIITTGGTPRLLGVKGESEFAARGVSYCATCDGNFFRNKNTAVVGGGNTAVEDAIFLSRICTKVYLIHRRDSFRATKNLVEKVKGLENVEILYDSVVEEIMGEAIVNKLKVKNLLNHGIADIDVNGVFVAVGTVPNNIFVKDKLEIDGAGYIKTDIHLHTSKKGVFAAGDARNTPLRQVVTAAADGAIAANSASLYIAEEF